MELSSIFAFYSSFHTLALSASLRNNTICFRPLFCLRLPLDSLLALFRIVFNLYLFILLLKLCSFLCSLHVSHVYKHLQSQMSFAVHTHTHIQRVAIENRRQTTIVCDQFSFLQFVMTTFYRFISLSPLSLSLSPFHLMHLSSTFSASLHIRQIIYRAWTWAIGNNVIVNWMSFNVTLPLFFFCWPKR